MEFKHPEILYFLFLLIVPILVHLFQLRRFQKQYFTNVALLKEIEIQTRKSSKIKKWLLLATRLCLLTALIIAFAQPYFKATEATKQNNELVIVLDNSFSMQAKGNKGELLKRTIQEILEDTPENQQLSILTNDNTFYDTDIKSVQSELQNITYSSTPFNPQALITKIQAKKTGVPKDILFISDAVGLKNKLTPTLHTDSNIYIQPLTAVKKENTAIENVSISEVLDQFYKLKITLNYFGKPINDLPISLYNGNKLLAKALLSKEKLQKEITFTIPKTTFHGYVQIEDQSLVYDNSYYFSITKPKKTSILAIGNVAKCNFLRKIYTEDEFNYTQTEVKQLKYSAIENQEALVLNELPSVSSALLTTLKNYYDKGGTIIFIPDSSGDKFSYNSFLKVFGTLQFNEKSAEKKVTTISYNHPIYQNVFEKKVTNFQYPKVNNPWSTIGTATSVLQYEDKSIFLGHLTNRIGNLYVFTSALSKETTNFQNAPLIVPTFFNMGQHNLSSGLTSFTIGESNSYSINETIAKDNVLTVSNASSSFIPMQQILNTKIKLTFGNYPEIAGNYQIMKDKEILNNISFNYPRSESNLETVNETYFDACTEVNSIATFFNDIHSNRSNTEIWRFFILATLLFLITELLIQKLIK